MTSGAVTGAAGAVVITVHRTQYASIFAQAGQWVSALRAQGVRADLVLYGTADDPARDAAALTRALDTGFARAGGAALIQIDFNGKHKLPAGLIAGRPFRRVVLLVDHIHARFNEVAGLDPNDLLCVIDDGDRAAARRLALAQQILFLPHGGPVPRPAATAAARDIPILFVGNLVQGAHRHELDHALGPEAERLGDLVWSIVEDVADRAAAPVVTALDRLDQAGIAASGPGLARLLTLITQFADGRMRHRWLTRPTRHPILLFGEVRPGFFTRPPPHLDARGQIAFDALPGLLARTRVLLNPVAKFPDGTHERIYWAMAHGAAVVAAPSRYLGQSFAVGREIAFPAGDGADFTETVDALAADGPAAAAMAAAAAVPYASGHLFAHRAASLLAALATG